MVQNVLKGINTLLFDLDNTLLHFNEEQFFQTYALQISKYFNDVFSSSQDFIHHLILGTKYMSQNEGIHSNIDHFMEYFLPQCNNFPEDEILSKFEYYYENEFENIGSLMRPHPLARLLIEKVFELNFQIVIATNPLFPESATHVRLNWAGLDEFYTQFALVTDGENSNYSKPSKNYYLEILKSLDKTPEQCLMIGNDKINDGAASLTGIKFYYVLSENFDTPEFLYENVNNQINVKNIAIYSSGTLEAFFELIKHV